MGQKSDPTRYDRIEEMVGQGLPDAVIAKAIMREFDLGKSQAYAALRQFERETRELRNKNLADRRARMITQLETLHVEARETAKLAREGYEAPSGSNDRPTVRVRDPKAAAIALGTCQQLLTRIIAVDGLSVEAEHKAELARLKLLEKAGVTPEQLETMIASEVTKAIDAMPTEELERRLEARRAG